MNDLEMTSEDQREYLEFWKPLGYGEENFMKWHHATSTTFRSGNDKLVDEYADFFSMYIDTQPDNIGKTLTYSFSHQETEAWWDLVCGSATKALEWISLKFTLEDAISWYGNGAKNAYEAKLYTMESVEADKYGRFHREFGHQFITNSQLHQYMMRWIRASGESGDRSIDIALKWYALHHSQGIDRSLKLYIESEWEKIGKDNKSRWQSQYIFRNTPGYIRRYIKLGATPEQAMRWEELVGPGSVRKLESYTAKGVPVSWALEMEGDDE